MSIQSIESIGQQLLEDNAALQTYLPPSERTQPIITNLIATNFALTYLHVPEHVVSVRTTLPHFGRLVASAHQFIDDHK